MILTCFSVSDFAVECLLAPSPQAASSNPPDLFSSHGVLKVEFSYQTITDADGRHLFCFMTPDGLENPTLHVNPGDHLIIN